MNVFRKSLSAVFVIISVLSLIIMVLNGFELVKFLGIVGLLSVAAALNSMGGKVVRVIGYINSALIVFFFSTFLEVAFTLEPNSTDSFPLIVIAITGISMGLLSSWGIYSLGRSEKILENKVDIKK